MLHLFLSYIAANTRKWCLMVPCVSKQIVWTALAGNKTVARIQSVDCGFCTAHSTGRLTHSILLSRKFSKELYIKLFIWNKICLQAFIWRNLNWCYRLHKNTVPSSLQLHCPIYSSFPICLGADMAVPPSDTQETLTKQMSTVIRPAYKFLFRWHFIQLLWKSSAFI
jgi:hypothetical protein